MKRTKLVVAYSSILLGCCCHFAAAQIVIGSFDGTRTIRPFSDSDYSNIRADISNPSNFGAAGIVNQSVTFAPDTNMASATTLSGLDIFIVSEVTSLLQSEIVALGDFVRQGNCLVLISNSLPDGRVGADLMLQALDGGMISDPIGGNSGDSTGTFVAAAAATVGPFGSLVGGTFAATPGSTLTPGSATVITGRTDGNTFNVLGEIPSNALSPGSGGVLIASDVLFMNFFVPPASLGSGNVNNSNAFLNFVAAKVPEPGSLSLLSAAVLFFVSLRRRA